MYSSAKKSGVGCESARRKRTTALTPTSPASRAKVESAKGTVCAETPTRRATTSTAATFRLSARSALSLKTKEGAVSRALRQVMRWPVLRAGAGRGGDVATGALLVPGLRPDRAAEAVRDGVRSAQDDHVLDTLVVGLHVGQVETRVALRVVGVVGLDGRDRCAHVRLGGRVVRPVAEGEVRRHRDREQDAEDDDDNEKLDEGETLLLTSQALLDDGKQDFAPLGWEP